MRSDIAKLRLGVASGAVGRANSACILSCAANHRHSGISADSMLRLNTIVSRFLEFASRVHHVFDDLYAC